MANKTNKSRNNKSKNSKKPIDIAPQNIIDRPLVDVVAELEKYGVKTHIGLQPKPQPPVPMLLWCPMCHERHIDVGEFAATRFHTTHSCQFCGMTWRPAVVNTVGVQFLPGFKDEPEKI